MRAGTSGLPAVHDLALPGVRRLGVQAPVVVGDVIGIERRAGRNRPGTVTVATWTPAGRNCVSSSSVSARTPALPSDRLTTSGIGVGIPPVMR